MSQKKCIKCNQNIEKNFDFCPFCGENQLKIKEKENYGFLGRDDVIEQDFDSNNNFEEKIIKNAMKIAERIIEKHLNEMNKQPINKDEKNKNIPIQNFGGMQLFINGKKVFPPEESKENFNLKKENNISIENINKLSKLPREEPQSKMKRIGNRIVYEMMVPGVKNLEDIFITQLENSIEIKAVSEEKVYSKKINVKLPIIGYGLNSGNLILELQAK